MQIIVLPLKALAAYPILGVVTTCHATTTCEVKRQDMADVLALTFNLHQDIRQTKRGIAVTYQRPSDSRRETVMLCSWPQPDTMECSSFRGNLEFDRNVTDHLTLLIPSASDSFSGAYFYQLLPPKDEQPCPPCNVFIEAAKSTTRCPVKSKDDGPSVTPAENEEKPEDSGQDITTVASHSRQCDSTANHGPRMIFMCLVAFAVGVITATVTIIIVVTMHRKNTRSSPKSPQSKTAGSSTDTPASDNEQDSPFMQKALA